MSLDFYIFHLVNDFAHHSSFLDFLGIFFASYLQYILVAGFLIIACLENSWQRRVQSIAAGFLSALIGRGIIAPIFYFFIDRQRPFVIFPDITSLITHGATNAFPSGHAMVFFGLAIVMYLLGGNFRTWSYIYAIFALLIGIARIFVGVHYPLDIVGGLLVGTLSAWLAMRLIASGKRV